MLTCRRGARRLGRTRRTRGLARARYSLREGSDAWLVYDERQTEERGPRSTPAGQSRAPLLELNHTFLP